MEFKKLKFIGCFITLIILVSCKKTSKNPYFIDGYANGVFITMGCNTSVELDKLHSQIHLYKRPKQTLTCNYDILFTCDFKLGKQEFDSLENSTKKNGIYMTYVDESQITSQQYLPKIYISKYSNDKATINITEINEKEKTLSGNFSGILSEQDSSWNHIEISDGKFFLRYE
jgi:hypothetical protein